MASTNFKIFNEDNTAERTFNDSEYESATQRQSGVIPGIALSRLHNKLYLQVSAMAKAVADFIVAQGNDCYDNDVAGITTNLQAAITNVAGDNISEHNSATDAHSALTATIDDTLTPTADENTLRNLLSNLAYEIKENKGTSGWKDAPGTTLASLATLVSNLASGSDVVWNGKKFTNAKLGITGLMDTNGYVSFGPNFGGLIIQWGKNTLTSNGQRFTFPLTSPSRCFVIFANDRDYGCDRFGIVPYSENTFVCWNRDDTGRFVQSDFSWIALCI